MKMHLVVALLGALMLCSGITAVRYTGREVQNYFAHEGNKYVPDPKKFEKVLGDKLDSEPAEGSIMERVAKAAESLLTQVHLSSTSQYAAKLFMDLPEASGECDEESFWILRDAYVSAYDDWAKLKEDSNMKMAIDEALEKHGQHCRSKYMAKFNRLSDRVEFSDAMRKVEKVISSDDIKRIFGKLDLKARLRSTEVGILVPSEEAGLLKKWKSMAAGDARNFFSSQIYRPCLDYYKLTARIFQSARLDLVLDDEKLSEINPSKEFIDAWLKFRVCDSLLYPDTGIVVSYIQGTKL